MMMIIGKCVTLNYGFVTNIFDVDNLGTYPAQEPGCAVTVIIILVVIRIVAIEISRLEMSVTSVTARQMRTTVT